MLRAAAFSGDVAFPERCEVLVIGGGIMGVATAYNLAKRKIQVVLCEKAEIACEASSRAVGWVSELMVDRLKQPMTQLSKRLWHEMAADVGETGFRADGLINLAESEEQLAVFREWLQHAAGTLSSGTRILTSGEVADRLPSVSRVFPGGLFSQTDGSVEPVLAATAIAEAARRCGAAIVTDCAVRGLDLVGGRVGGVFTEKGYIKCSTVICATNTWTRLFCGNHGVEVPQIYVVMSMGSTTVTGGPVGAGGANSWAWRRQIDGRYALGGITGVHAPLTRDIIKLRRQFQPLMKMMGGAKISVGRDAWNDLRFARHWNARKTTPFERHRVLSGTCDDTVAVQSLAANAQAFPEMRNAGVDETWSGPITLTPDNMPILGPVEAIPGLHLITGCSYGISWAPAVGKMMSELVAGDPPCFDPRPFRLSRFTDGSPIVLTH
jgi:glycine/D-amino acid oxidase-like deaminating enzyme